MIHAYQISLLLLGFLIAVPLNGMIASSSEEEKAYFFNPESDSESLELLNLNDIKCSQNKKQLKYELGFLSREDKLYYPIIKRIIELSCPAIFDLSSERENDFKDFVYYAKKFGVDSPNFFEFDYTRGKEVCFDQGTVIGKMFINIFPFPFFGDNRKNDNAGQLFEVFLQLLARSELNTYHYIKYKDNEYDKGFSFIEIFLFLILKETQYNQILEIIVPLIANENDIDSLASAFKKIGYSFKVIKEYEARISEYGNKLAAYNSLPKAFNEKTNQYDPSLEEEREKIHSEYSELESSLKTIFVGIDGSGEELYEQLLNIVADKKIFFEKLAFLVVNRYYDEVGVPRDLFLKIFTKKKSFGKLKIRRSNEALFKSSDAIRNSGGFLKRSPRIVKRSKKQRDNISKARNIKSAPILSPKDLVKARSEAMEEARKSKKNKES